MLILTSDVQFLNANDSIIVPLSGRLIVFKPVQPLKADEPILVTLFGIVILLRILQSLNALFPILLTQSGIIAYVANPILVHIRLFLNNPNTSKDRCVLHRSHFVDKPYQ